MPDRLIVVAGENLIDRIVSPDGRSVDVPGGGPFNTARALGRLGARVAYLGRISTDANGKRIRKALSDDGVDLSLAVTTDDPTLIAHATLDAAGAATYRFDWEGSAAAGLRGEDLPTDLPSDLAALHVGTLGLLYEPMASTIAGLVDRVGSETFVMVDANVRPAAIVDEGRYRARLGRVTARADVVKVSVDDLGWMSPGVTPAAAAARVVGSAGRVVLITDGPHPVEIVGPWPTAVEIDVPAVSVVDTIGAGDAFGAGFLATWMGDGSDRRDLRQRAAVIHATRFAIAVAAWTVGRAGADPPRLADLGEVF